MTNFKKIKTVSDFLNMPAGDKKKLMKKIIKEASEDQREVERQYEEGVKQGKFLPIK